MKPYTTTLIERETNFKGVVMTVKGLFTTGAPGTYDTPEDSPEFSISGIYIAEQSIEELLDDEAFFRIEEQVKLEILNY